MDDVCNECDFVKYDYVLPNEKWQPIISEMANDLRYDALRLYQKQRFFLSMHREEFHCYNIAVANLTSYFRLLAFEMQHFLNQSEVYRDCHDND